MKKISFAPGFSMVEVMVAALIMGVGMLGVLTLQARSVQFNQQAYYVTQGGILLKDIAERMAANSDSASAYRIDGIPSSSSADCTAGNCTSAQLVQWDLVDWGSSVERLLPNGTAEIGDGVELDSYYILIRFSGDKNFSSAAVEQELRLDLQL
ncbi:MAG: type IV pilus modification protein PilV [Agarilytica sp.]